MNNEAWDNDEIQFARLLCEIAATQDNIDLPALAESMDLSVAQVNVLFDRANAVFERSKEIVRAKDDAVDTAINYLNRSEAVEVLRDITAMLFWDDDVGVWDFDKEVSGADLTMNIVNQFPASIIAAVKAEMKRLEDLNDLHKNVLFVTKVTGTEIMMEYEVNAGKKEYADYVSPPSGTYKHRRSGVTIQVKGLSKTRIIASRPDTKGIDVGDYFDLVEPSPVEPSLAEATDLIDSKTLSILREKQGTGRWAAYVNMNLSSYNGGHAQFLLVGEGSTFKEPPDQYPVDNEHGMGWQYRYCGMVNMTSGLVEEDAVGEEVGKLRSFHVTWAIDVEAVSPRQAALKALRIQRQDNTVEPEGIESDSAVVFTVAEIHDNGGVSGSVVIDLEEDSRCD